MFLANKTRTQRWHQSKGELELNNLWDSHAMRALELEINLGSSEDRQYIQWSCCVTTQHCGLDKMCSLESHFPSFLACSA
jgi:hypothetical protein